MSHGRVRGIVVLRAFALGLLVVLSLPAGAAQEVEAEPLFFADKRVDRSEYNLTSVAPVGNENASSIQFVSTGSNAEFTWTVGSLPAPWNVGAGSLSHATVYLSGLDELFPAPGEDLEEAARTVGKIRIEVQVLNASQRVIITGTQLFEPRPWDPRDDIFEINVDMRARQAARFDPARGSDLVDVRVLVSGRDIAGTNVSPVHMHLGAESHPSQVRLADFPYDAFRLREAEEQTVKDQKRAILTPAPEPIANETVTSEPPDENTTSRDTPFPSAAVTVVLALLSLTVHLSRPQARTARSQQ